MRSRARLRRMFAVLAAAAYLAGCGGDRADSPTGPEPGSSSGEGVASITVTADGGTLTYIGHSVQLEATARDGQGRIVPGVAFAWSSSDTSIVGVDETGQATARADGTVTIVARSGEVEGSAALVVDQTLPDPLAPVEARAMADILAAAVIGGFDTPLAGITSGPQAPGVPPIEIDIEFEIARPCPLAGEIHVSGTLTGVIDPEEHSGTLTLMATKVVDACTFKKEGVTFVVNSEGDGLLVEGEATWAMGEWKASLRVTGVLAWEADDGRSDSCEIDVSVEWSSGVGAMVTGSVCGHDLGDTGGQASDSPLGGEGK